MPMLVHCGMWFYGIFSFFLCPSWVFLPWKFSLMSKFNWSEQQTTKSTNCHSKWRKRRLVTWRQLIGYITTHVVGSQLWWLSKVTLTSLCFEALFSSTKEFWQDASLIRDRSIFSLCSHANLNGKASDSCGSVWIEYLNARIFNRMRIRLVPGEQRPEGFPGCLSIELLGQSRVVSGCI